MCAEKFVVHLVKTLHGFLCILFGFNEAAQCLNVAVYLHFGSGGLGVVVGRVVQFLDTIGGIYEILDNCSNRCDSRADTSSD